MLLGELNIIEVDEVVTHPDSTSEETLLDISVDDVTAFIGNINLDLDALTQNATIRVYYKIDGSNYRRRYGTGISGGVIAWTTSDGPWVPIVIDDVVDHDIRVTLQSAVSEGAPRQIPLTYNNGR